MSENDLTAGAAAYMGKKKKVYVLRFYREAFCRFYREAFCRKI